jgi:ABC-2 type transport system permease protein
MEAIEGRRVAGERRGRPSSVDGNWRLLVLNLRFFMREPFAVFFTLAFPVLLVLAIGAAFGNLEAEGTGGYDVADVNVPAVMALVAGNLGLIGIPIAIAELRQTGMLKRYRLTPTPLRSVFGTSITAWFLMFCVAAVLAIATTAAVFGLRFGGNPLAVLVGAALAAAAMFSLGFLIGGFVESGRSAQAVGSALFFPMLFLSGASFPRQQFPQWLQDAGEALPLTHAVELLVSLWIGESLLDAWPRVLVLAAIAVAATVLCARTFKWS